MSKYESKDLQCPYCSLWDEASPDSLEPDLLHKHECSHCEKRYTFTVEYSPDYYTQKADCLNGGEHDWQDHLADEDISKPETWYLRKYFELKRECSACGKDERRAVKKEGGV